VRIRRVGYAGRSRRFGGRDDVSTMRQPAGEDVGGAVVPEVHEV